MRSARTWIVALTVAAAALPAGAQQIAAVSVTERGHDVAIEPIARALGWSFRRTREGATVDDGTGPQTLRIGSRMVEDDGLDVPLFDAPVGTRYGKIALAISDAATLFHLGVRQDGAVIALTTELASSVTIREIPRPAAPPPVPVATAQPTPFAAPETVSGTAGTFDASVLFAGNERIFQTNLASTSGNVRGSVSSYGSDALSTPVGSVVVGPLQRNITLGSVGNPLGGDIIQNGSLVGVHAHIAGTAVRYDLFSGRSFYGNVVAVQRTHGDTTEVLSDVSSFRLTQLVLRRAVVKTEPWGTFGAEMLAGQRGVGAAVHARTKGKTFIDATVGAARGRLPLTDGDLPIGAVIGRHLGPVTTVTAGFVDAIGAPGSPTLGIATRLRNVALSGNVSRHWTNVTASFGGPSVAGSVYASAGAQSVVGITAGIGFRRALAEVNVSSSGGTTSGIAQLRTTHTGLNIAAGLDLEAGRIGPLVGLVATVTPTLAFEAGLVAGPNGRPALRLSVLAGIRAPRPRVAMFPVTLFVPEATRYGPLKLFIDGAPATAPFDGDANVNIAAGRHSLYVVSADNAYASLAQDVLANAATSGAGTVTFPLFPQRTIVGRIRFGGPAEATPAEATLSGIRIVLEPSGQSTTTDAQGRFEFARAPYDPNSTLLIDPASLTAGFVSPVAMPVGVGPLDIPLLPERGIERTTFPPSSPGRSAPGGARTAAS